MRLDDSADSFAAAFSSALIDPSLATPAGLVGPFGKAAVKRYNVYRNNVTVGLIDALAAMFPATQRIVGVEFFRTMAWFHIRAAPPTSTLLFEYGRDFPAFVETYEHAQALPWLADVSRLERAWLDAYHAADEACVPPEAFGTIPSARLVDLVFATHPSARIIRSRYPAVSIFAMNRSEGPITPFESSDAEDGLITRPDMDVVVRRLAPGSATFLIGLMRGETLGAAAAAAYDEVPSFDLPASIACMIEAGLFTEISGG